MVDGQNPGRPSFFRKPGPAGSRAPGRPVTPPPPPPPPVVPPPPAPPIPPDPLESSLVPPAEPLRRPTFHGSGGTLFGIHVVNTLLTIVTVGIYYFWAKTRLRQYLFGQAEIDGDRFAYHGTGRELLLGTLKAALVFGVPISLLNIIRDVLDAPVLVKLADGVLSGSLLFVLFPVAMVGARRYRLGRTSWRGIRFSFRGRVWDLIKIVLVGTFLTGITLGLYYPVLLVKRQAFMISNSYFGSERFGFAGRGRDLFWVYVQAALLTVPTLGLSWVWYAARQPASVRLMREGLEITTAEGGTRLWPYRELRQTQGAYAGEEVRLERGGELPETLLIADAAFLQSLHEVAPHVGPRFHDPRRRAARLRWTTVAAGGGLAATVAIYPWGIPLPAAPGTAPGPVAR